MNPSKYATPMTPVPADQVPVDMPAQYRGSVFKREINVIGPQTQFLCMAIDGNCFSSGFSLDALVASTITRLAYENKTCEQYAPSLAGLGMWFSKSVSGNIVMHEVRDPKGQLHGIADGRAMAAEMAEKSILALSDPKSLSTKEFGKICFAAYTCKQGKHVVYDGDTSAMDEIKSGAQLIWHLDEEIRSKHPDRMDFTRWFCSQLLRLEIVVNSSSSVPFTELVHTTSQGHRFRFILCHERRIYFTAAIMAIHSSLLIQQPLAA